MKDNGNVDSSHLACLKQELHTLFDQSWRYENVTRILYIIMSILHYVQVQVEEFDSNLDVLQVDLLCFKYVAAGSYLGAGLYHAWKLKYPRLKA